MSSKRDDMTHWGWDILLAILSLSFCFFGYEKLTDPFREYGNRDIGPFIHLLYLLGNKHLVYFFFFMLSLYALYNAICKIKKIKQNRPKGIARFIWIFLRLGAIVAVWLMLIDCEWFLWQEYKAIIIGVFSPLVAWLIFMKTKNPIAPFPIIIAFMLTMYAIFWSKISQREIEKEQIKTIAVIEHIKIEEHKRYEKGRNYRCLIDFRFNDSKNRYIDRSIKGTEIGRFYNMNVGDTIIVAYSPKCDKIRKVINLFPASEEIEKYKQGELYINREIY